MKIDGVANRAVLSFIKQVSNYGGEEEVKIENFYNGF